METPVDQPIVHNIPEIQVPESKSLQEPITVQTEQSLDPKDILGYATPGKNSPKSPQNQPWDIKQSGSFELLTPSPLGFTSFDSRSIDELITPDEFGSEHIPPGLSNINYDIDLSDLSGDNSLAEDSKEPKDPFSPEGLTKDPFDQFRPHMSVSTVLDKFDEFSLDDHKNVSDPYEVVHKSDHFSLEQRDPFSPIQRENPSLLDDNGSPTAVCLLPSPLQPQTKESS